MKIKIKIKNKEKTIWKEYEKCLFDLNIFQIIVEQFQNNTNKMNK